MRLRAIIISFIGVLALSVSACAAVSGTAFYASFGNVAPQQNSLNYGAISGLSPIFTNSNPDPYAPDSPMALACTAKDLYVSTGSTQGSGGTLTIALFDANTDTAQISVVIAASSIAGTYSNTTSTASLTAGHNYEIRFDDASGAPAQIRGVGWYCSSAGSMFSTALTGGGTVAQGVTAYAPISGQVTFALANGFTTNSNLVASPVADGCTAKDLYVTLHGTNDGNTTVSLYNVTTGTATALSVSVPAGSGTGAYSNTTSSATVTSGDSYALQIKNTDGSQATTNLQSAAFMCTGVTETIASTSDSDLTIPANQSSALYVPASGYNNSGASSTFADAVSISPITCTNASISVTTDSAQPSGGDLEGILFVDGAYNGTSFDIPGGTAAGNSTVTVSTPIDAGNSLVWGLSNSASSTSAKLQGISITCN